MSEEGDTYVIEAGDAVPARARQFSRRLLDGDARDRRRQAPDQDSQPPLFHTGTEPTVIPWLMRAARLFHPRHRGFMEFVLRLIRTARNPQAHVDAVD